MSNECSSIVWKRDLGTSVRKLIAARLADHADDEGRGIWPSVERIAAQCNTSPRTVQRTLAAFVEEGVLRVVSEGGRGPSDTRRYDFNMRILGALPLAKWGSDDENKGDTVSPLEIAKGDTDDNKGDTDDKKGCHGVTQTSIEPPIEPSERESVRERDFSKTEKERIERDFKRWYPTWPTYVQDSEDAARKQWIALTDDERAACIDRTPDYIAAVERSTGRKPTKFAGVYLKERGWAKLGAVAPVNAKPVIAAPFSRAMMAQRLAELCRDASTSMPAPPAFQRSLIAQGGAAAESIRLERRRVYGWPSVNLLDEQAASGKGTRLSPIVHELETSFQMVPSDTPLAAAWRAFHLRQGFPWPSVYDRLSTPLFFPSTYGIDGDLDVAVATAFADFKTKITQGQGHDDAA